MGGANLSGCLPISPSSSNSGNVAAHGLHEGRVRVQTPSTPQLYSALNLSYNNQLVFPQSWSNLICSALQRCLYSIWCFGFFCLFFYDLTTTSRSLVRMWKSTNSTARCCFEFLWCRASILPQPAVQMVQWRVSQFKDWKSFASYNYLAKLRSSSSWIMFFFRRSREADHRLEMWEGGVDRRPHTTWPSFLSWSWYKLLQLKHIPPSVFVFLTNLIKALILFLKPGCRSLCTADWCFETFTESYYK